MFEERASNWFAADLAPFTAPVALRGVLERYLPPLFGRQKALTQCAVPHAYFKSFLKPSTLAKSTLSVCDRFQCTAGDGEPRKNRLVYLKAYVGGRSQFEFNRIDAAEGTEPQEGEAVVHLPELGAIVRSFPHDPGLPHLPKMLRATLAPPGRRTS